MIGGCFSEYLAPCNRGDLEASPGKACSRLESEDWDADLGDRRGGPDMATPTSVGLREPYPGLSRWLESAMRPFVAEAERVRIQLQRCEARVQELENAAAPGRLVQAGPMQPKGDAGSSKELHRQLREEVRQPNDVFQAVAVLEMQMQRVMDSVSEVEVDVKEIKEQVKQIATNDLDFGAPIGKTLNTQDYAQMNAELRAELDRCRERLDDLTPRVYNQFRSQENSSGAANNGDNRYEGPAAKDSAAGMRNLGLWQLDSSERGSL